MSAGSERGPGARAASTDAEYPYTFDDLCLALDWLAAGLCDCVAQAWVLSDILRAFASSPSPSSLFGRDGGLPGKPPTSEWARSHQAQGPTTIAETGGGAHKPQCETSRRAAPGGVGPEGGGRRGADRKPGPG